MEVRSCRWGSRFGARSSPALSRSWRSRSSRRCCRFRFDSSMNGRAIVRVSGDAFRDELGVVLHPTEKCRAARVLPVQAQEEQPRIVGDTASMTNPAVLAEHRNVDPVVIGSVAGCPDDAIDLEFASIREGHRTARSADDSRLDLDAMTLRGSRTQADKRFATLCKAVRCASRPSC